MKEVMSSGAGVDMENPPERGILKGAAIIEAFGLCATRSQFL